MRGQAGFFDIEERLKELSAKGDTLERLSGLVDFELFRPDLERAVPRADRSRGGRPPFEHVLMFKVRSRLPPDGSRATLRPKDDDVIRIGSGRRSVKVRVLGDNLEAAACEKVPCFTPRQPGETINRDITAQDAAVDHSVCVPDFLLKDLLKPVYFTAHNLPMNHPVLTDADPDVPMLFTQIGFHHHVGVIDRREMHDASSAWG